MDEIFKEISSLDCKQAFLLQRDISKAHIFINQGKISGIIDLGFLTAGDPRKDIAKCLMFQNPKQQEYFKKGYGNLAEDPVVLKYIDILSATKMANNLFNQKGQWRPYKKPPNSQK